MPKRSLYFHPEYTTRVAHPGASTQKRLSNQLRCFIYGRLPKQNMLSYLRARSQPSRAGSEAENSVTRVRGEKPKQIHKNTTVRRWWPETVILANSISPLPPQFCLSHRATLHCEKRAERRKATPRKQKNRKRTAEKRKAESKKKKENRRQKHKT